MTALGFCETCKETVDIDTHEEHMEKTNNKLSDQMAALVGVTLIASFIVVFIALIYKLVEWIIGL